MKSFAQALHSDDRYRIMMIDDPVAGLRPITFEDHHGMVARLRLPITAPKPSSASTAARFMPFCMAGSTMS